MHERRGTRRAVKTEGRCSPTRNGPTTRPGLEQRERGVSIGSRADGVYHGNDAPTALPVGYFRFRRGPGSSFLDPGPMLRL